MRIEEHFKTPLWSEERPDFVKSLTKATNKYIQVAKKLPEAKQYIKRHGDFGRVFHSTTLLQDNNFRDFRDYVGKKSWEFLDHHGYDMKQYTTFFSELWVQEFAKKGGGNHLGHIHGNQHVSGFYFLKCSDKTAFPIFHDPRTGTRATKLKLKENLKGIWLGSDQVHYKPKPGSLMIFPGYMEHEFTVDLGEEPLRFIHWNIIAIPKVVAKDV